MYLLQENFKKFVQDVTDSLFSNLLALWDVLTKDNAKPVDDLNKRDNAEAKTEAKAPTKIGDEFHPCHSFGLLVLWRLINFHVLCFEIPCAVEAPK